VRASEPIKDVEIDTEPLYSSHALIAWLSGLVVGFLFGIAFGLVLGYGAHA
jgi:hypothetical protein